MIEKLSRIYEKLLYIIYYKIWQNRGLHIFRQGKPLLVPCIRSLLLDTKTPIVNSPLLRRGEENFREERMID